MPFMGFKHNHFTHAPIQQVKDVLEDLKQTPDVAAAVKDLHCYISQQPERAWICWFEGQEKKDLRKVPQLVIRISRDMCYSTPYLNTDQWLRGKFVEVAFDTEGFVQTWEKFRKVCNGNNAANFADTLATYSGYKVILAKKAYDPDDPRPYHVRDYVKHIVKEFNAQEFTEDDLEGLLNIGVEVRENDPCPDWRFPSAAVVKRWEPSYVVSRGNQFATEVADELKRLRGLLNFF